MTSTSTLANQSHVTARATKRLADVQNVVGHVVRNHQFARFRLRLAVKPGQLTLDQANNRINIRQLFNGSP